MAQPIIQQIKSAYNSAGARKYLADLRKIQEEQEKIFGAKGTDGAAFGGNATVRRTSAQTKAMRDLRETAALARIEFDKLNLANRRGEISNEHFQQSVKKLRARVTPDLVAIRNSFEEVPRAVEVQYGRAMVTLDRFGTRAQEVATGQTRLRTRIGQAIRDQAMFRLPGGHLLAGLGVGGGTMAAAGVGVAAAAGIAKATAMASKYEDALREVRKTTGGTREETEALGDDLLDLSVKLGKSEIELATIAATAGQLGIRGSEDITKFTETTAKLAAVSDLTAEEAANALGKVANAFGLPISESERLGSVINGLSNITAASSRQIVDALQRVGPGAESIGLAVDQVAALGAMLIETGIESSRAGTMLRNIFTLIQTRAEDVAKALGVTKSEFDTMITEDAVGTLQQYFAALQKLPPQIRTIEINKVFGQRNLLGVQALAKATEEAADGTSQFSTRLAESNTFLREATSLQEEYEIALDTTSGQLGLLWQRVKANAVAFAGPFNTALRESLKLLNEFLDSESRAGGKGLDIAGAVGLERRMRMGNIPEDAFHPRRGGVLGGTGATPDQPTQTIKERIEALQQERDAIIESGEATERLADVNRELNALTQQRKNLAAFGLGDDTTAKAQAVVQKIIEAQDIAARGSDAEKKALQDIFRLQEEIAKLEAAQRTLGADAVRDQLEFARQRLEIARRELSTAEELRQKIQEAAGDFEKLAAKAPGHLSMTGTLDRRPDRDKGIFGLFDGSAISSRALRDVGMTAHQAKRLADELNRASRGGKELEDTLSAIGTSIRSVTRMVDIFGDLDDNVRHVAEGVADVLENIGRLENLKASGASALAQATSVIGAAAGVASIVMGIVQSMRDRTSAEETLFKEHREELKQLREALRDNARRVSDAVDRFTSQAVKGGAELTGEQAAQAKDLIGTLMRMLSGDEQPFGANLSQVFVSTLERLGDIIPDFDAQHFLDLFRSLEASGITGADAIRRVLSEGLQEIFDEMLVAGEFGDNISGAIESLRFFSAFMGGELMDRFRHFMDFLLGSVEDLSPELRRMLEEAAGLDLSTAEGRARLNEIISTIATLAPGILGGLTPAELEALLRELKSFADGAPSGDEFTRSVQIARSLTEIQANELIAIADEQLWTQGKMLEQLQMSVQLLRDIFSLQAISGMPMSGIPNNLRSAIRSVQMPRRFDMSSSAAQSGVSVDGWTVNVNGGGQLDDRTIDRILSAVGEKLRGRSSDPLNPMGGL